MIGPVLYQEMLLGARRNRAYYFRWCYAGWIVLQLGGMMFIAAMMRLGRRSGFDHVAFAAFCREFLETLLTQHYLVLALVTPVLAAGAITDEKWRGTLQYLLVTELYSWEILIGKLIGRLYQVCLIAITPLPVICFLGVFGGLDLLMLLSLAISSLVLAFALGSMSLLASVLCRHTRDAVLGMYAVGAILFGGGLALQAMLSSYALGRASVWLTWLTTVLNCLDPLHPMGTGWSLDDPVERGRRLVASVLAWGLVGLICLLVAALRLRGAYLRYLERASTRRWWPVVLVVTCIWAVLGLALLLPYLLMTGQLMPYLDGTSARPWNAALFLFMLVWIGIGLVPQLLGIGALSAMGKSRPFLDGLNSYRERNWLTRRAGISNDPIRWKERIVEGIAPLAGLRALPRWLGVVLIFLITSASSIYILADRLEPPDTLGSVLTKLSAGDIAGLFAIQAKMAPSSAAFSTQGFLVMLLTALVIAIRCSGAVTGEREKSTWEALLLTPLETKDLIRGKLKGIVGAGMPYLAAYALPALALSAIGGILSFLMTLLTLAVTILAMFFVGAAGLWCSVRAKTSWRSLLGTLGITYVGGSILSCVALPVIYMVALALFLALMLVERQLGINLGSGGGAFFADFVRFFVPAICITLAVAFAIMAWRFVVSAEYRVGVLERTKHWREEPQHPRWSKHARQRRWEQG